MGKKMAVRNKENKFEKGRQSISLSLPLFNKPSLKVMAVFFLIGGVFLLIGKVPSLWNNVWPIEKIAFAKPINHIDKKQLARLVKSKGMGSMLSIELTKLHEEILKNPWVREVDIRKKWPDTLVFSFQEYRPIAIVNNQYLIETGSLIANENYIDASKIMKVNIEGEMKNDRALLLALTEELKYIKEQLESHFFDVSQFVIDNSNNCAVDIRDKYTIKIGRKHRKERIERFLNVYAAIENKEKLQSIDLRYSNGLAVKVAQEINNIKKKG